jgi:hypothetical protein
VSAQGEHANSEYGCSCHYKQEILLRRHIHEARRSDAILAVLQAQREALIRLRDEGQIDDEVLRTLQRELDLEESRVHTGSVVVH